MIASRAAGVVKRHPLITFFVLAYAVAWAFVPFGSFGAFGPLVAALVVIPLTQGRAGLRELGSRLVRWRVRWFWYLVALGLPLAIHLLTAGLHTAAGADGWSVSAASVYAAVLTFLVRLVNPTDGPLGEEPGWRQPPVLVGGLVTTVAVTYWYAWLFNRTEGSVLLVPMAHSIEGSCRRRGGSTWACGAPQPSR